MLSPCLQTEEIRNFFASSPLRLAKISITPAMELETPELTERLEQYQLRAKDVFCGGVPSGNSGILQTISGKTGKKISKLNIAGEFVRPCLKNAMNSSK